MRKITLVIVCLLVLSACQDGESSHQENTFSVQQASFSGEENGNFNAYWYAGEAELNSYELEQARYGEIHTGHAVLVFVTEDFSKKKQVKLDYRPGTGDEKVSVMKLNFTKKFNTGIYPYSLMQSVFTPVSLDTYPNTLKTTTSVQEWCGHVFSQMNLTPKGYRQRAFSYFESEGDIEETLPKTLMEDELWNRIRLDPIQLPTGKQKLIPASFWTRLKHTSSKPLEAELSLAEDASDPDMQVYTINYPSVNRSLAIHFDKVFPHAIRAWEEKYMDGGRMLSTQAKLKKRIKSAYWNKHNSSDLPMRAELGLPME